MIMLNPQIDHHCIFTKLYKIQKRRAISNIIATLMLLVVVVSVGSVILFQGVGGINSFNISLTPFQSDQSNANLESLVIEHVHFDTTTGAMTISVRNTGTTSITVDSVRVTKIDSQDLVISDNSVSQQIFPGNVVDILESPSPAINTYNTGFSWSTASYNIAIVTARGTGITTTEIPFNT